MMNPFVVTLLQTTKCLLSEAVNVLIKDIQDTDRCISLVFFGSTTNATFVADCQQIKSLVQLQFKVLPLVSFVPQPLCGDNTYGLEITSLNAGLDQSIICFNQCNNIDYAVIDLEWGKTLIVEGVYSFALQLTFSEQNNSVFDKIEKLLKQENFSADHIVRQWNYVGDITGLENGNQRYQLFNNARSKYYETVDFSNGYPAATGISMSVNSLMVGLVAILPADSTTVKAVDNSLQIPAHKYSCSVLIDGETVHLKTTPKFERAKWISDSITSLVYISGTAAIRNEKSSDKNDAALQTTETIDILNFLISNANLNANDLHINNCLKLTSIRVYVKNCIDYEIIKPIVEAAWPSVKSIYLQAGVCRQELLVEIEGIAELC